MIVAGLVVHAQTADNVKVTPGVNEVALTVDALVAGGNVEVRIPRRVWDDLVTRYLTWQREPGKPARAIVTTVP